MRSSSRVRRLRLLLCALPSSRARKHSSAMLSAASTAIFSVSPAGDSFAASCIFSSTYAARSAIYVASRWLRIGYRIPLISTLTTRESMIGRSEVQRFDLFQHVADARPDLVALGAQRRELGA